MCAVSPENTSLGCSAFPPFEPSPVRETFVFLQRSPMLLVGTPIIPFFRRERNFRSIFVYVPQPSKPDNRLRPALREPFGTPRECLLRFLRRKNPSWCTWVSPYVCSSNLQEQTTFWHHGPQPSEPDARLAFRAPENKPRGVHEGTSKRLECVSIACAFCCLMFAVTQCQAAGGIDFGRGAKGGLLAITNHTLELIGPFILLARYIVHFMGKEPIRPDFFYDFLEQRTQPTFTNLINQVRVHQPYIYQLFQVILVMTNITGVVTLSVVGLRLVGTCGASTSQDVTINYRVLFRAYTFSAVIVCAIVIVGGGFVLTCDFRIDTGVDLLTLFVHGYRDTLNNYLTEDVVNVSRQTFNNMVMKLRQQRDGFGQVVTAAATNVNPSTPDLQSLLNDAAHIDNVTLLMFQNVIRTFEESTLFQRQALMLVVSDLMSRVEGQLHTFIDEVDKIKIGVMNMTSILLTPGKNLLYIPTIQKVVKYSILSFVAFLCLSMGGMMTGFILGYANHNDRASPLDRSRLSNVAGYFLVATSYGMLVGCTCMLFFSDAFMLLGSIGDLYLCRSTREYNSDVALKDLAVSLVMNATVNRHHVQKLLKYSRIEQHCVEHQGIAGLAGIRREDLRSAFENIVQIQYDLANHFTADVDYAVTQLLQRHALLQAFTQSITAKTPTLKLETVAEDIKFGEKFSNDTVMFKSIAITACQDYSLEKCDEAKTDILSFLDQFESIGACKKIQGVFHESFRILCDGMLDYVNGFWFAMLLLVIVFDYAIYISLVGSKYLYTMTTYTYEGEPVPEGQTHRKQKARRRVVAATEDERMRQEQAEKYRIMRLRRMARDPDGVIKDISPSIQSPPTSEPEPEPQPLTSNISGSSQGAHSGSMEPMKPSQAKPVAVPPPASRVPNDDLATEFRF
ncbi:uncharacterized protein LOC144151479 isoform X3 [Haemaphysalis longicornis]